MGGRKASASTSTSQRLLFEVDPVQPVQAELPAAAGVPHKERADHCVLFAVFAPEKRSVHCIALWTLGRVRDVYIQVIRVEDVQALRQKICLLQGQYADFTVYPLLDFDHVDSWPEAEARAFCEGHIWYGFGSSRESFALFKRFMAGLAGGRYMTKPKPGRRSTIGRTLVELCRTRGRRQ